MRKTCYRCIGLSIGFPSPSSFLYTQTRPIRTRAEVAHQLRCRLLEFERKDSQKQKERNIFCYSFTPPRPPVNAKYPIACLLAYSHTHTHTHRITPGLSRFVIQFISIPSKCPPSSSPKKDRSQTPSSPDYHPSPARTPTTT